jgi:hypothetical protein
MSLFTKTFDRPDTVAQIVTTDETVRVFAGALKIASLGMLALTAGIALGVVGPIAAGAVGAAVLTGAATGVAGYGMGVLMNVDATQTREPGEYTSSPAGYLSRLAHFANPLTL